MNSMTGRERAIINSAKSFAEVAQQLGDIGDGGAILAGMLINEGLCKVADAIDQMDIKEAASELARAINDVDAGAIAEALLQLNDIGPAIKALAGILGR